LQWQCSKLRSEGEVRGERNRGGREQHKSLVVLKVHALTRGEWDRNRGENRGGAREVRGLGGKGVTWSVERGKRERGGGGKRETS